MSDKPLDPAFYQDAERWADEVQAVIDAKRLHRPILVGWSMGGRIIGQYLAVRGAAALGGINLVSARAVAEPAFSGIAALDLPQAEPWDMGSEIAAASAFLRACYHRQPSDADFGAALAYNMVVPAAVLAALRSWPANAEAAAAAFRALRVPLLITHGRRDPVVLPAAAEHVASLVPGAELSWYDDVGHSPFIEEPDRFNRELAEFAAGAAG